MLFIFQILKLMISFEITNNHTFTNLMSFNVMFSLFNQKKKNIIKEILNNIKSYDIILYYKFKCHQNIIFSPFLSSFHILNNTSFVLRFFFFSLFEFHLVGREYKFSFIIINKYQNISDDCL